MNTQLQIYIYKIIFDGIPEETWQAFLRLAGSRFDLAQQYSVIVFMHIALGLRATSTFNQREGQLIHQAYKAFLPPSTQQYMPPSIQHDEKDLTQITPEEAANVVMGLLNAGNTVGALRALTTLGYGDDRMDAVLQAMGQEGYEKFRDAVSCHAQNANGEGVTKQVSAGIQLLGHAGMRHIDLNINRIIDGSHA